MILDENFGATKCELSALRCTTALATLLCTADNMLSPAATASETHIGRFFKLGGQRPKSNFGYLSGVMHYDQYHSCHHALRVCDGI